MITLRCMTWLVRKMNHVYMRNSTDSNEKARMPDGYNEKNSRGGVHWHEGPPRLGTIGTRATRFRVQAGLLTWNKRMGSDIKNAKILSFIPEACKRANSTRSFRDFNTEEQAIVATVLKGSAPGRGRYAKRDKGDEQDHTDDVAGEDNDNDETEIIEIVDSDEDAPGEAEDDTTSTEYMRQVFDKGLESAQRKTDTDTESDESDKPLIKRRRITTPLPSQSTVSTSIMATHDLKSSSDARQTRNGKQVSRHDLAYVKVM